MNVDKKLINIPYVIAKWKNYKMVVNIKESKLIEPFYNEDVTYLIESWVEDYNEKLMNAWETKNYSWIEGD